MSTSYLKVGMQGYSAYNYVGVLYRCEGVWVYMNRCEGVWVYCTGVRVCGCTVQV